MELDCVVSCEDQRPAHGHVREARRVRRPRRARRAFEHVPGSVWSRVTRMHKQVPRRVRAVLSAKKADLMLEYMRSQRARRHSRT